MLADIIETAVVLLLERLRVQRPILARFFGVRAPPTFKIFAVKKRGETCGWSRGGVRR